jgi:predicted amidohydrolase
MACNLSGAQPNGPSFTPAGLILDPKGCILEERFGQEGVIFADFSAQRLGEVRSNPMGFFLRVRRPEVYLPHLSRGLEGLAESKHRL